jgi:hypothetical protein
MLYRTRSPPACPLTRINYTYLTMTITNRITATTTTNKISIFSQYGATFAAVSCSTAYAVVQRPPNGIALMLVAGAAGSLLDMTYAWNVACADQVRALRTTTPARLEPKSGGDGGAGEGL